MTATIAEASGRRGGAAGALEYLAVYRATAAHRIGIIKAGVPAAAAKRMTEDLQLEQRTLFDALNLKTATVNRKAALRQPLSVDESERVVGMAKLMGQLQAMVEDSGEPDGFDAGAWLSRWLREPLPALGGTRPIDLLDTIEGQSLVSESLARIQSGAYA